MQIIADARPHGIKDEIHSLACERIVRLLGERRAIVEEDTVEFTFTVRLFQVLPTHPVQVRCRLVTVLLANEAPIASEEEVAVNEDCGSHSHKCEAPRARQPHNLQGALTAEGLFSSLERSAPKSEPNIGR